MPRLWIGILGFLLVFAGELRAQGEIVLFVGNDSVDGAEWVRAFRQSPLASLASDGSRARPVDTSGSSSSVTAAPRLSLAAAMQEFSKHFIEHKLQVCAARDAGIDTLAAFQASWRAVRARLRKAEELDEAGEEQALRRLYRQSEQRLRNNRWVRVAHITRYLPQQGGSELERRNRQLMDSLYAALQAGTDFAELARRYSEDRTTAEQGGVLPWMPVSKQVQEWTTELDRLACNQVSRPFFSPLGIHLVKWVERKEGLSFEECREQLADFRERRGIIARRAQTPESEKERQEWEQSVYEGLLVAYAERWLMKQADAADAKDWKRFFEQHRDRYAWSLPHFQGAVLSGADKKAVKRLRKYLKKRPFTHWKEAVRLWKAAHPEDSLLQVEMGLFRIGSQPAVDKLVYRCGTFQPDRYRPVVQVVGKNLKRGPECWEDVREAVIADYRVARKEAWIQSLHRKYKVEINEEVLKTVNIDGNQ